MPKLFNTVTKKYEMMPDSYVGQFPYEVVEEEPAVVTMVIEKVFEKPKRKRKAEYVSPTVDGDGDGLVQDGTIFERPVGTELSPEEVTAILEESEDL